MSVLYIGAYAWSYSYAADSSSSSTCGATSASGVSVSVSDTPCCNCTAMSISGSSSYLSNAHGGSMSVLYIGAYAWSISRSLSNTSISCGSTSAIGISANIKNTPCSNCSAMSTSGYFSYSANAHGGSMSVVHVGAYAWSSTVIGSFKILSRVICNSTWVSDLSIFIVDSSMVLTEAISSKCSLIRVCIHMQWFYLTCRIERVCSWCQCRSWCYKITLPVMTTHFAGTWRCYQCNRWMLCLVNGVIWFIQRNLS
jgi:hypothetical protein